VAGRNDEFAPCADRGYYPFSAYLRGRFGCKVQKISLNAGFTCPNRDGTVGRGGCTYCVNESFNPQAGGPIKPIREQMADGMAYMKRRYRAEKFFAYFQAFTNTFAAPEILRARYDEAVGLDDVVGLSIGTRPDCVPDPVLNLVESYTDRMEVWLEYGLQSASDKTLDRVNRGHDVAAFRDAVERTRGRGIKICAHVILGMPGETWDDMMATARFIAAQNVDGVKLHHLYIARGTAMEKDFRAGRVEVFSASEYVKVACDFLERIQPSVTIQRLVGDTTSTEVLIAPHWPEAKSSVLRMVTDEFRRRGTTQGTLAGLEANVGT